MRSLRLDPELDAKVRRAAAMKGESISEFIRGAAEERADKVLDDTCSERFTDIVGVIRGGGGRASRSGKAFTEQLRTKKR
jgi:hypothetical protein